MVRIASWTSDCRAKNSGSKSSAIWTRQLMSAGWGGRNMKSRTCRCSPGRWRVLAISGRPCVPPRRRARPTQIGNLWLSAGAAGHYMSRCDGSGTSGPMLFRGRGRRRASICVTSTVPGSSSASARRSGTSASRLAALVRAWGTCARRGTADDRQAPRCHAEGSCRPPYASGGRLGKELAARATDSIVSRRPVHGLSSELRPGCRPKKSTDHP